MLTLPPPRGSDHKSIRQHGPFLDHDDSLFYIIQGMIGIFQVMAAVDPHIVADTAVLIHDGIADITTMTDPDRRQPMRTRLLDLFDRLIEIHPHQVTAHDRRAGADARADTDDTALYPAGIDDTALCNDRLLQGSPADLCRGQHTGPGINGLFIIK